MNTHLLVLCPEGSVANFAISKAAIFTLLREIEFVSPIPELF